MTDNRSHSSFFFRYPATPRGAVIFIAFVLTTHAIMLLLVPGMWISDSVRFFCSLIAAAASYTAAGRSSQRFLKLAWYSVGLAALFMAAMNSLCLIGMIAPGTSPLAAAWKITSGLSMICITASMILFSQSIDSVTRIRRHINIACIIWITIGAIALPVMYAPGMHNSGIVSTFLALFNSYALLSVFITGLVFYWISIWRKEKKRKLIYILILANVALTYLAGVLPDTTFYKSGPYHPGIFTDLIYTAAYLALPAAAWAELFIMDRAIPLSDPRSFNLFYVSRIERIIPGISLLIIALSVAGMAPVLKEEFLSRGIILIALFALLLVSFEWMSYRSEDSLLAILSISPVAIQITDRSMKKNYFINSSMFSLYRTGSIPADNLIASAAVNDKKSMLQEALARRNSLDSFETEFLRSDGSSFTAQCRIVPARYYSYSVLLIWMNDTTERKEFEETLARERDNAESQSYYRGNMLKKLSAKMLSGYILGHYKDGPEGIEFYFSEVNAQALEIINSIGGIEGKRFRDIFPEPTDAIVTAVREVYTTGDSKRIEVYSRNLDRHLLMVIFKPGGNEIAILLNDITEQKKAEQLIRENEERARRVEKVRDMGQMAGGIAHELNNRLMGISSYLSLIDMKLADPEIKKYTNGIHEIIKQSSDLIDSVLTFARQIEVQKEKFRVHPVIQKAVEEFSTTRERQHPVSTDLSAQLDSVFGDRIVIHKALAAVLSNAGDAVQESGSISITTANTDAMEDSFLARNAAEKKGKFLLVKIKDTGRGIETENLERIFDPFFTTKPVGKGQGLGLSAVYGAVQSHGGLIRVDSSEGLGTEFSIYLPCSG